MKNCIVQVMSMIQCKLERVYDRLRDRVVQLPAGARLPSVRELMDQHRVSQYTIDRTLTNLEQEGLIYRRPGRGIFVAGDGRADPGPRARRIMVAVPSYPSSISDLVVDHLQERIAAGRDVASVVRYNFRERVSRWLPREKADGLIIIPPAVWLGPEHVYWLDRLSVPVVVLAQQLGDLAMDCVDTDNEMGGALAADYLIKLGHRRLAVMMTEPHTRNTTARRDSFVRQAKLAGLPEVRIIDCGTRSGEFSCEKGYRGFSELLSCGRPDFSGLFVQGDAGAWGVLKACFDAGLRIPRELSVVGFDNLDQSAYSCPALTTVGQDFATMADEALTLLYRRIDGDRDGHAHRMIAPRLIIRESTAEFDREARDV